MHQKQDENGSGPFDFDRDLREQQGLLLSQIDTLVSSAGTNREPKVAKIYNFKQEYNILVKKRGKLSRNARLDPMDVLPPDLWPGIVESIVEGSKYPINELLDLISVSKGWFSVLTTLPVIWTGIWLDQSKPDYLAKAMMCIHLSGECEIDLILCHLTSAEWKRISSMIVPEGRRIWRLECILYPRDSILSDVLEDFTELPELRELVLPCHLSDLEASITKKMPSIRMISIRGNSHGMRSPYITSHYLHLDWATQEDLDTLPVLPQLRHLSFSGSNGTLEYTPSKAESSFESLTSFSCTGLDVCRYLTWVGSSLSLLSTWYAGNGDVNALLVGISRFPHLHSLRIYIPRDSWTPAIEKNTESVPASPGNTLKVLKLVVTDRDNSIFYQRRANWDAFFPRLFAASPRLEVLDIYGGFITDLGWKCIQDVANLRDLTIVKCGFGESSLATLKTASLRNISWSADVRTLVQVLAKVQSPFVQNLTLTQHRSYPHTNTTQCIAPGSAFPNITSLAISAPSSCTWEISTLSRLRELVIFDSVHLTHRVSDFCGAIIMRPRDNPALAKITIDLKMVEWDMLLLMLERRNFLNEPAISPIETLVFSYDLSYRLLYPLSELLGGRFVERDSNHSFSVEAIGERMCNGSINGCVQCHYSFQECKSHFETGTSHYKFPSSESIEIAQKHNPPHEYLVAEPPLHPDVALWLSGTRDRRTISMKRFEEIGSKLGRPWGCEASKRRFGGSIVNGDILAGAHFADELEENDAGLEAGTTELMGK